MLQVVPRQRVPARHGIARMHFKLVCAGHHREKMAIRGLVAKNARGKEELGVRAATPARSGTGLASLAAYKRKYCTAFITWRS